MEIYALGTVFVELALGLIAFITAQGFASVAMVSVLSLARWPGDSGRCFDFGAWGWVAGPPCTIISQGLSIMGGAVPSGQKTGLHIRRENLRGWTGLYGPCLALGLSPFIMQSTGRYLCDSATPPLQRCRSLAVRP